MQPRPSITKSSGETGGGAAGRRRLPLSCRASRFPFSPPPPCSPGHAKSNEARQLPARRGMEGATPPTGGAQSRAICATSFRSQLPGNSVLCLCSRPRGVSRRALCSRKKKSWSSFRVPPLPQPGPGPSGDRRRPQCRALPHPPSGVGQTRTG